MKDLIRKLYGFKGSEIWRVEKFRNFQGHLYFFLIGP